MYVEFESFINFASFAASLVAARAAAAVGAGAAAAGARVNVLIFWPVGPRTYSPPRGPR